MQGGQGGQQGYGGFNPQGNNPASRVGSSAGFMGYGTTPRGSSLPMFNSYQNLLNSGTTGMVPNYFPDMNAGGLGTIGGGNPAMRGTDPALQGRGGGGFGPQMGNPAMRGGFMQGGGGFGPQGGIGRSFSTQPMQINQPRMMDTGGTLPGGLLGQQQPQQSSNYFYGQGSPYATLNDALAPIAQRHPELAGQRVNLRDQGRFPELFQNGNYIGPNPASTLQRDASMTTADMGRGDRVGQQQNLAFLQSQGKPANYTGPINGMYWVNGIPLNGAGEADFNNMFNLQLPGA